MYIHSRTDTRFEWDENKAKGNFRKHGILFEEAARVFADPFALVEQDRIVDGEYRWQTTGLVEGHLLLLVAHTIEDDGNAGEVPHHFGA